MQTIKKSISLIPKRKRGGEKRKKREKDEACSKTKTRGKKR